MSNERLDRQTNCAEHAACERFAPLLDAYVDRELSDRTLEALERHLERCARCREELTEIRDVKRLLAGLNTVPDTRAAHQLDAEWAATLDRLRAEPWPATQSRPSLSPRTSRPRALYALRAAAALLVTVSLSAWLLGRGEPTVSLAWAPGAFAHFEHEPETVHYEAPPLAPPDEDLANVAGATRLPLDRAQRRSLAAEHQLALATATFDARSVFSSRRREEAVYWSAELAGAATARTLAEVRAALLEERIGPELAALLDGLDRALARRTEAKLTQPRHLARAIVLTGKALLSGNVARVPKAAPSAPHDAELEALVRAELERIRRARGIERSPITGARIDYGALPPRNSSALRHIERALAWLGAGLLPLDRPETARTALLLVHTLLAGEHGRLIARYERIREAIDFLEGEPDGYPPARLIPWLRNRLGSSLRLGDITDGPRSKALFEALAALPGARIPGPERNRPLASLLGQRYGLEAEIAARLSFPVVGTPERARLRPSGLDLLAALEMPGALQALRALEGTLDPSYLQALEALRTELEPARLQRGSHRGEDLTWLWIYALEGLVRPETRGSPPPLVTGRAARIRHLALALAVLTQNGFAAKLPGETDRELIALAGSPRAPETHARAIGARGLTEHSAEHKAQALPETRIAAAAAENAAAASAASASAPRAGAAADKQGYAAPKRLRPSPPPPLVEPAPEWFARLAALVRAVAAALAETPPDTPGLAHSIQKLRALAARLDQLTRAARLQAAGLALDPALERELADPIPFCERFLPGPTVAVSVIAHLDPGVEGRPTRTFYRVVAGFDALLALTKAGRGNPLPLALARGPILRVHEIGAERRLEARDVLALPRFDPAPWAAPLYGFETGGR